MGRHLFFFLYASFIIAQTNLTVIRVDADYKILEIEEILLKHVVDLYNQREKEKITITFQFVPFFKEMFDALENTKGNNIHQTFAMSSITITEERRKVFDFSSPYFFIKESIFGLKEIEYESANSWQKSGVTIGYVEGTLEEKIMNEFQKKYNIRPVAFKKTTDKIEALLNKEISFFIADHVAVLQSDEIKILEYLKSYGMGFGLMFPKGSKLEKKMSKYIHYTKNSKNFINEVKQRLGENITNNLLYKLKN